jgi:hypothetical protein
MATHAALAASRIPATARLHSKAASKQVRACVILWYYPALRVKLRVI